MRNYAAVPHDYFFEMLDLNDEEFGRLIRALLIYSMDGVECDLPGNERFFWRRVVNRENGLQEHYNALLKKRSEAGKKGAQARWENDRMANDSKDGNVKEEVEDKDKEKDKVYSLPSEDGMRAMYGSLERWEVGL